MSNATAKEEAKNRFIPEAKKLYGDLYDYSKVVYGGTDTKVIIICRIHGEFLKTPYNHIKTKEGCPKCSSEKAKLDRLKKKRLLAKAHKNAKYKKCPRCGKEKKKSEFYFSKNNLSLTVSQCKACVQEQHRLKVVMSKPLKMYKTHKLCPRCEVCKEVREFNKNRSTPDGLANICKECEKLNRENRVPHIRKYRREYYEINKESVIQKEAEYKKKKALYGSYADKLTSQESPVDKDGLLFVKCKNCGKSFSPTNGAVQARVFCLNHFGIGESHLYCSTKCKDSCDVFRAIKLRKSERSVDKVSRNCQQYIKKELQKIQCDSSGNTYCEKCGDIIGIELHHTNQVKDKVDTNNPAGMMLLCFRCHREAHTECK